MSDHYRQTTRQWRWSLSWHCFQRSVKRVIITVLTPGITLLYNKSKCFRLSTSVTFNRNHGFENLCKYGTPGRSVMLLILHVPLLYENLSQFTKTHLSQHCLDGIIYVYLIRTYLSKCYVSNTLSLRKQVTCHLWRIHSKLWKLSDISR